MAIKKIHGLESEFLILPNSTINDTLSWGAKGLLVYLCSKPDNWSVSVQQLTNHSKLSAKPTGRDGTYTLVNELMAKGYMRRVQGNANGKFSSTEYEVSPVPLTAEPDTAEPYTANPTLQSTINKQSTEVTKLNINIDQMFESFWFAGMKKVGKKAALNQFKTAMKKHGKDDPQAFTDLLVNDVKTRVAMNQFGFDKLHPERYLKNERWTDEVSRNETNQNTNQQRPLSAVERVAAANGFGQQTNQPDQTGYPGAVVIDGEYVRS